MGSLIGYARVSTAEQSADLQTDELTAAGCLKVFVEHMPGAVDRRPQLDRALGGLRAGDTLVVWRDPHRDPFSDPAARQRSWHTPEETPSPSS